MRKQRSLKILKYLKISLLIPFAFLLLVHFVIKDRGLFFATIFNVFGVPFLIIIGLFLSIILYPYKRIFKTICLITFILMGHWFYSYYGFKRVPVSPENNHILFWNIDNSRFLPREIIHEKVKIYNPEIIVFIETRKLSIIELKYLKEQFPQYEFNILQGFFLVGIKGKLENSEYIKLRSNTKYNLLKTNIDGRLKTMLIADIGVVKGYRNNREDIDYILEFSLKNNVDIIVGDFNTPYESMHFDGFKENYKSFHKVSEGFAATWPKGLPLLELDQFWASPEIQPISLKKFFYKDYSNHDMVIGSFKFMD